MSKLKSGFALRLSVIQFAAILFAVIHAMSVTQKTDAAADLSGTAFTMFLFGISLVLVMIYVVAGPHIVKLENTFSEDE